MLDIKQKKKHLLLLNKILRSEIKSELIIPVPSKLSEEEVNKYFDRLFVKKSEDGVEYYVPIKNKLEISIDEGLFKSLLVKKKKVVTKEEKQLADEERLKKIAVNVYNKFNKEVIEPYALKRRNGENVEKEEKELVRRYVKFNKYVKELIKKNWKNLYMRVLEPLEKGRSERKENLKEEEKKLMMDIKDKVKEERSKKSMME